MKPGQGGGPKAVLQPRGERGAAMVEFALILPILMLLVFGIIEFGIAFNADSNVNQSARAGGRTAAILSTDPQMGFKAAEAAANSLAISPGSITGVPTICVAKYASGADPCASATTSNVTLVNQGTPGTPTWSVQVAGLPPGVYPPTDGWPVATRHFGCATGGAPGTFDKVVVHVEIDHRLVIPNLFGQFLGDTATPTLASNSVFQLEPVPSTSCP